MERQQAQGRGSVAPWEPQNEKTCGTVQVHCYSGPTYAGRPQSFVWQGAEIAVEEILSQWREPAGPVFHVRTTQGDFVLAYEERRDRWWLREG